MKSEILLQSTENEYESEYHKEFQVCWDRTDDETIELHCYEVTSETDTGYEISSNLTNFLLSHKEFDEFVDKLIAVRDEVNK